MFFLPLFQLHVSPFIDCIYWDLKITQILVKTNNKRTNKILQVVPTFHWNGNLYQDFAILIQHKNKGGHFKEGLKKVPNVLRHIRGILGSCLSELGSSYIASHAYTLILTNFSGEFSIQTQYFANTIATEQQLYPSGCFES